MFDSDLSYLLEKAGQFAYSNFHEYLTSEHVLFVLVNLNEETRDILADAGLTDVDSGKFGVKYYLGGIHLDAMTKDYERIKNAR